MLRAVGGLRFADVRLLDVLPAVLHLAFMPARLRGPRGVRAVIAENFLLKQQLIVLRRRRQRSPKLTRTDRLWLLKIPNILRRLMFGSSMDTLHIDDFRSRVDDAVGPKLSSVAPKLQLEL